MLSSGGWRFDQLYLSHPLPPKQCGVPANFFCIRCSLLELALFFRVSCSYQCDHHGRGGVHCSWLEDIEGWVSRYRHPTPIFTASLRTPLSILINLTSSTLLSFSTYEQYIKPTSAEPIYDFDDEWWRPPPIGFPREAKLIRPIPPWSDQPPSPPSNNPHTDQTNSQTWHQATQLILIIFISVRWRTKTKILEMLLHFIHSFQQEDF